VTKPKHLQDPNKPKMTHGGARPNEAHVAEWTVAEDDQLFVLHGEQGLSGKTISGKLHRSQGVVLRRIKELGIIKPVIKKANREQFGPPRPPPAKPAGAVTLPPLPSLQEPMYIIPRR